MDGPFLEFYGEKTATHTKIPHKRQLCPGLDYPEHFDSILGQFMGQNFTELHCHPKFTKAKCK